MGVYIDFKSNQQKWTIHGILQHMGFYPPTENPCMRMRQNLKTTSSEYIIIYHDELYIASTTPEEILNICKTNMRSILILNLIFHMILVEELLVNSRNNLKSSMQMSIFFSKTTYLKIYTLILIKKGNLNLIHNRNSYQHLLYLSQGTKLDK